MFQLQLVRPQDKARLLMGDECHAIAHTVGVDVLAFCSTGVARGRIQVWTSSILGPVRGLDRIRGLSHSGDRLHSQDEVK